MPLARLVSIFKDCTLHDARPVGLEFQHPRPVFAQLASAVYGDEYHRPEEALADSFRRRQFRRQLARLEQLLPAGRRSVLDVGCGAGAFLRFARDRGWKVDGTDIVVTGLARRTGARLWDGQLPNINFDAERRFDVVRLNHVLEHFQNPLGELQHAREIVASDGILLVGVPNLSGVTNRLKHWQSRSYLKLKRWKHYGALQHLWFFNPRTLGKLVQTAGFDVVYWKTPVPERPGRWEDLVRTLVRVPLEAVHGGGLLDLYARAR